MENGLTESKTYAFGEKKTLTCTFTFYIGTFVTYGLIDNFLYLPIFGPMADHDLYVSITNIREN